jgi:hypothetical protein
MTVIHEPNGYVGGYLVTNAWGRPLEFRLSTAVQPNRIQQILYGGALQPYIFAELIGKALIDRTTTAVQLLLTDKQPLLELRPLVEPPIVCLTPGIETGGHQNAISRGIRDQTEERPAMASYHPNFPGDEAALAQIQAHLSAAIDLSEPFARIREAIGEARKTGATTRG